VSRRAGKPASNVSRGLKKRGIMDASSRRIAGPSRTGCCRAQADRHRSSGRARPSAPACSGRRRPVAILRDSLRRISPPQLRSASATGLECSCRSLRRCSGVVPLMASSTRYSWPMRRAPLGDRAVGDRRTWKRRYEPTARHRPGDGQWHGRVPVRRQRYRRRGTTAFRGCAGSP
jgi:hypothetical protein